MVHTGTIAEQQGLEVDSSSSILWSVEGWFYLRATSQSHPISATRRWSLELNVKRETKVHGGLDLILPGLIHICPPQ